MSSCPLPENIMQYDACMKCPEAECKTERQTVGDYYYPSPGLTVDVDNIGDAGADVRQWIRA